MTAEHPAIFKGSYLSLIGFYIFCVVLVLVLTMAVNIEVPSAMGVIVVVFAAVAAGQKFRTDNQRRMLAGEKAQFSAMGAIALLILSALTVVAIALFYHLPLSAETLATMFGISVTDVVPFLMVVMGGGLAVSARVIFFSIGMGKRLALKQHAKLTGK